MRTQKAAAVAVATPTVVAVLTEASATMMAMRARATAMALIVSKMLVTEMVVTTTADLRTRHNCLLRGIPHKHLKGLQGIIARKANLAWVPNTTAGYAAAVCYSPRLSCKEPARVPQRADN